MTTTHSLTEGPIFKVLLRFSVPFMLAALLQALYGAVDLMVIGRFCPSASVAAVSTGTQITQIITSLISGLTLGGTILIAKYTGRNEPEKVRQAAGTTLMAFFLFSLALTLFLIPAGPFLLRLLKIPEESFAQARQYVLICSLGTIFICGYNALSAILRGLGDSLSPLLFVAVACFFNIAGDLFTVGVLGMGPAGTALATVLSQALSMAAAVLCVKRKTPFLKPGSLKIHLGLLRELAALGIPVSFQECMVRVSFLYLTAVTNSLGVLAASAVGIANKYDVFAMLPATSISAALAALTAQNLGAGRPERAARFLACGMAAAFGGSALFFAWAQLAPASMIQVFSSDPAVIEVGIPFFRSCSLDYLAVALLFCLNGYLNGKERTVFTMMNCCAGALLVRVPLLFLLSHFGVRELQPYGLVSPFSSAVMLSVILAASALKRRKRLSLRPRMAGQ